MRIQALYHEKEIRLVGGRAAKGNRKAKPPSWHFMSTDYKVYYETVTVNGFSCLIVMEKKSDSADLPQTDVC